MHTCNHQKEFKPSASITEQNKSGVLNMLKILSHENILDAQLNSSDKEQQLIDTLFVGGVPNDTVVVTGTWSNNGPIYVFNDGVLIFQNANATVLGNCYVFQNGKMLADSSTLFFPQQYFYQRELLIANNGFVQLDNCTLNYGGLSHSLVVADSATVIMNNVYNNDWTTAGVQGHPTVTINGTNLAGEYILSGDAVLNYSHVNTLLLWHQFPAAAVINYSFPSGDTLDTYNFNNSISGISGINYNVHVDTSYNVWWGMMPVNGSDVTISNSTIRSIGAWFTNGDTVNVSGLVNNSSYTNFTAPLADRNLHLINCDLQTWSLYVFDSSSIDISGCILGEVGSMGRSWVTATGFFCDGSGGYFWASDTSVTIASQSSVTSYVRSEKNGFMIFGYGTVSNGIASAINNSVLIVVQSSLPQDPVANDGSVAWFGNIAQPNTAFADTFVTVTGSAWIDQGPLGSWMDFGSYKMYFQQQGNISWLPIDTNSTQEVRNATLALWDTHGLIPGNYSLRLVLFNDLGDSVEAIKSVTLLPSVLGFNEISYDEIKINVVSNNFSGETSFELILPKTTSVNYSIYNSLGAEIKKSPEYILNAGKHSLIFNTESFNNGIYFYRFRINDRTLAGRFAFLN